jgi:ATP-independent RNA helicase DbpA
VHVHRVGRTGRADEAGWAFSLAGLNEMERVARIEKMQEEAFDWHPLSELTPSDDPEPLRPPMATVQILGGRKDKIRRGDVLGALTKDFGLRGDQVGRIDVNEFSTYVAVDRSIAREAARALNAGKVKGKTVKARRL